MELEVLSVLIENSPKLTSNICSIKNKKTAAGLLGIEDHNTLNNYVKKLKDKGALTYTNKKYTLPKLLLPTIEEVNITII